jgi:hypothetical protein
MQVSVKDALTSRGSRVKYGPIAIKPSILSKFCGALKYFGDNHWFTGTKFGCIFEVQFWDY